MLYMIITLPIKQKGPKGKEFLPSGSIYIINKPKS